MLLSCCDYVAILCLMRIPDRLGRDGDKIFTRYLLFWHVVKLMNYSDLLQEQSNRSVMQRILMQKNVEISSYSIILFYFGYILNNIFEWWTNVEQRMCMQSWDDPPNIFLGLSLMAEIRKFTYHCSDTFLGACFLSHSPWLCYLAFFNVFNPAWAIIDFCFLDNFLSGPSLLFFTGPECLKEHKLKLGSILQGAKNEKEKYLFAKRKYHMGILSWAKTCDFINVCCDIIDFEFEAGDKTDLFLASWCNPVFSLQEEVQLPPVLSSSS